MEFSVIQKIAVTISIQLQVQIRKCSLTIRYQVIPSQMILAQIQLSYQTATATILYLNPYQNGAASAMVLVPVTSVTA